MSDSAVLKEGIFTLSHTKHDTPLWFPDGEYLISVYVYDVWTPAGMLYGSGNYALHVQGNLYEDWYVK